MTKLDYRNWDSIVWWLFAEWQVITSLLGH